MAGHGFQVVTIKGTFTMTFKQYCTPHTPDKVRDDAGTALIEMELASNSIGHGRLWLDPKSVEGPH